MHFSYVSYQASREWPNTRRTDLGSITKYVKRSMVSWLSVTYYWHLLLAPAAETWSQIGKCGTKSARCGCPTNEWHQPWPTLGGRHKLGSLHLYICWVHHHTACSFFDLKQFKSIHLSYFSNACWTPYLSHFGKDFSCCYQHWTWENLNLLMTDLASKEIHWW